MRVNKIKNAFGLCAKKNCWHLISTTFEIIETDLSGNQKRKVKVALCDDCTFDFLGELSEKTNI